MPEISGAWKPHLENDSEGSGIHSEEKNPSVLRLYGQISYGQRIRLFKSAPRLRVDSFNAYGKMSARRRARVSVGYISHVNYTFPEGFCHHLLKTGLAHLRWKYKCATRGLPIRISLIEARHFRLAKHGKHAHQN
jgi:hypothetical protein